MTIHCNHTSTILSAAISNCDIKRFYFAASGKYCTTSKLSITASEAIISERYMASNHVESTPRVSLAVFIFVSYGMEGAIDHILCSSRNTGRVIMECVPCEVEGSILCIKCSSIKNSRVVPECVPFAVDSAAGHTKCSTIWSRVVVESVCYEGKSAILNRQCSTLKVRF